MNNKTFYAILLIGAIALIGLGLLAIVSRFLNVRLLTDFDAPSIGATLALGITVGALRYIFIKTKWLEQ